MSDVNITLSSDESSALRSFQRIEQALGRVAGRLDKVERSSKSSAASVGIGFSAATVAMQGLHRAADIFLAQQQRLREDAVQLGNQYDINLRKLQAQAGFKDIERPDVQKRYLDIAEANAVDPNKLLDLGRQLVSSGFEAPEKSGVLDSTLKILASNNLDIEQGADVAKSMGQFIAAFGKEKNQANLLDLGQRTRGLFKSTDVQLSDLTEFAKAAPVLSGAGVSLEDSLSALGILRETRAPGEAATGARNVVSSLTTAAASGTRKKALASLGLKPEDVDLVGETLPEALRKLGGALDALPAEKRNTVLTKLFEKENASAAAVLLGNVDKFTKFGGFQHDAAGFIAGVRARQSGPAAASARIEVKKQRAALADAEEQQAKQNAFDLAEAEYVDLRKKTPRLLAPVLDAGRFITKTLVERDLVDPRAPASSFIPSFLPGAGALREAEAGLQSERDALSEPTGLGKLTGLLRNIDDNTREAAQKTAPPQAPRQAPAARIGN